MDPENLMELSDEDRRNAKRFNHWMLIWGIMFFGVIHGMEPVQGGMQATPVWKWGLIFSPLIAGIFLVRAFKRLFGDTQDELIRHIHFGGLAVGFLFAFFIGMFFSLSALMVGASLKAAPLMFAGLLAGYFLTIVVQYRKYHA